MNTAPAKKIAAGPVAAAAVVLFYGVLQLCGITCPIKFLTGCSCAGCGMTRAWLALLHLDFAAAYTYHPLYWLPVPLLALYLLRRRLPKAFVRGCVWAAVLAALAMYACRLADPADSIVVFEPQNGAVWRFLLHLTR